MPTLTEVLTCPNCNGEVIFIAPSNGSRPFFACKRRPDCNGVISAPELNALTMKEGKPTFEQEQDAKRAETQQRYDLQMAAELERYRRDAALRLLEKLLETPENRQRLWDRYVMDRSEGKLAVDLANDLVKELGKVK